MQGDSGCYLYEASDGQHVTLRFTAAGDENLPPPALPPTSACSDGDDCAAALAENEGELWSARKTKFYIAQYTALKDLVGKTRTLWELAAVLEKEHSIHPRILLEPGKAILPGGNPPRGQHCSRRTLRVEEMDLLRTCRCTTRGALYRRECSIAGRSLVHSWRRSKRWGRPKGSKRRPGKRP
ncbi:uncharacterized protein LOC144149061 [Haemaphysalis longicornis]